MISYMVYLHEKNQWLGNCTRQSQGLIDPQSGERACNSAYACRDSEVQVVTKNRTTLSLKPSQNPLKMGQKPSYITHQRTREFLQLEGQRRLHSCLYHLPTHLVLFIVTMHQHFAVSTGIQWTLDYPDLDYPDLDYPDLDYPDLDNPDPDLKLLHARIMICACV